MKPCPKCGQVTAEQFFRNVGRKQLCVLCAHRSEEAEQAFRETIDDLKLHGGYKWLWKHIASVVGCLLGYLLLRDIISGAFRAVFGGN